MSFESIGRDLAEMQRVPLAETHVAALRKARRSIRYPEGTVLVHPGQSVESFVYVEDDKIELMNTLTGERLI